MSEDEYSFEDNLIGFYNDILDARRRTAASLRVYRNIESTTSENIEQQIQNQEQAKNLFFNNLDYYYDLMENKWQKSKVDKPEAVKNAAQEKEHAELFTVEDLTPDEAIILYKTLNKLSEDLEITSLENLQYERRKI